MTQSTSDVRYLQL